MSIHAWVASLLSSKQRNESKEVILYFFPWKFSMNLWPRNLMKNVMFTALVNYWIQVALPGFCLFVVFVIVFPPEGKSFWLTLLHFSETKDLVSLLHFLHMETEIKEMFFITSMLDLKSWWAIKYLLLCLASAALP